MKRINIKPRYNWQEIAEANGFFFHHVNGDLYWDESAYYSFTLQQIEDDLENHTQEIHDMCLDLVRDAISCDNGMLAKLAIPEKWWDYIRDSYKKYPMFYGRFDFSYDGKSPAKLLEYNADTPTALYEASYFQWLWLEDLIKEKVLPENTDQFNSIQEKIGNYFYNEICKGSNSIHVHFACMHGSEEDKGTVEYIMDIAHQNNVNCHPIYIENIGILEDEFVDLGNNPISYLFKLYPWEFIWQDEFANEVINSDVNFINPAWTMILSNKGILPLLWEKHKGHPNLLPAGFYTKQEILKEYKKTTPVKNRIKEKIKKFIVKPLLSREGCNISLIGSSGNIEYNIPTTNNKNYGREGYIWQEFHSLPNYNGNYPVCGVWVVQNQVCGLGIREDTSIITQDTSRFIPHIIMD